MALLNESFLNEADDIIIKHINYVNKHKENVKKAYKWLKENLPELFDAVDILSLDYSIEHHDDSKFSDEELRPYAERWFGNGEKTSEYNAAWVHHYTTNAHHPEFWNGEDMPYECILEMICDWWSFSFAKDALNEIFEFYFNKAKDDKEKNLSEHTKKVIEDILKKIKNKLELTESLSSNIAYRNSKKAAVDAVIISRARHLADKEVKSDETTRQDRIKYMDVRKTLGKEKTENLEKMVLNADKSDDKCSVDIHDDSKFKKNTNSITADFEEKTHMSLHVIKGESPILDKEREGRTRSTGYGENGKFIKDMTGKDIKKLAKDKFEAEKKKVGLTEEDDTNEF